MRDRPDVDVDPLLDAHLRRVLYEVAATIDPVSDTSSQIVRLVPSPMWERPPRRRRAIVAAAAIAGVAIGAGSMFVIEREQPGDVSVAVETLPPVTTLVPSDLIPLAEECQARVETFQAQVRDDFAQPAPPDPANATVLLFDTPAVSPDHTLIIAGESEFYLCDVSSPTLEPSVVNADPNVFRIPPVPPATTSDVQVVDRTSLTGADPYSGPGWVRLIGRAGPDVTSVELELPDGSTATGDIQNGWFVLEARLGDGVPDMQERVNWTTADGTEHSSRADLVDPPDQTEACAATPGCVTSEINSLLLTSQYEGLEDQAEILADLDVTDDEFFAARQRFADCVNASDYDITVIAHEDGSMALSGSDLDGASPDWEAQNNVQILCAAAHLDLVDKARSLLDAQQRITDN